MTWIRFRDMHSGGGLKEAFDMCFIEAPLNEAVSVFYARFGHSPYRVSCTCCGEDYSMDEYETLQEATAYHRNCGWDKDGNYIEAPREDYLSYLTLEEYVALPSTCIIYATDITEEERNTYCPRESGYVWVD